MAFELIITHKAEQDLDDILGYIVHKSCNTQVAVHLMNKMEKRYALLSENPEMYGECRQPLLKAAHYRKAVVCGYVMIYRVDSGKNTVIIERFFSDLEDYAEKL